MKFLNPENQIAKQKNKNKFFKGEKTMKNTKLKVLVVTLAVCLLAMGSLGTLAWFTAEDEVTNEFLIADSDDTADEIFSINVWEKDDEGTVYDDEGITYPEIQPGDDLYKEVNIENTGHYAQYIRATVTVTGASVWQAIDKEIFVDLGYFVTDLNADFEVDSTYYDVYNDTLSYVLYYKNILGSGEVVNLFKNVHITEDMTQYDAEKFVENAFNVIVKAEAVQTANVGANAIEAFKTVGMYKNNGYYILSEDGNVTPVVFSGKSFEGYTITNTANVNFEETTFDASYVQNHGEMTLSNSTCNTGDLDNYAVITRGADAVTVFDETNVVSAGGGVGVVDGAKIVFDGGKVYVDSASTSGRYIFYAAGEGTEIVINGGEFSWDPNDNTKRAYVYADAGTTVTINGGTFGKASTRSGYTAGILGSGTVVITGGTFGFNPSAWVAAGYVANYDATAKTWTVVAE